MYLYISLNYVLHQKKKEIQSRGKIWNAMFIKKKSKDKRI
jgi:hypothetical protein